MLSGTFVLILRLSYEGDRRKKRKEKRIWYFINMQISSTSLATGQLMRLLRHLFSYQRWAPFQLLVEELTPRFTKTLADNNGTNPLPLSVFLSQREINSRSCAHRNQFSRISQLAGRDNWFNFAHARRIDLYSRELRGLREFNTSIPAYWNQYSWPALPEGNSRTHARGVDNQINHHRQYQFRVAQITCEIDVIIPFKLTSNLAYRTAYQFHWE